MIEKIDFKMAIDTSLQYLVQMVPKLNTSYELALVNYALTLAKHPMQQETRRKLERLAVKEGTFAATSL